MIFDESIPGLGYAPDEPEDEEQDEGDYPNEDADMENYYEQKYKND